jgi:hypothetical protein
MNIGKWLSKLFRRKSEVILEKKEEVVETDKSMEINRPKKVYKNSLNYTALTDKERLHRKHIRKMQRMSRQANRGYA